MTALPAGWPKWKPAPPSGTCACRAAAATPGERGRPRHEVRAAARPAGHATPGARPAAPRPPLPGSRGPRRPAPSPDCSLSGWRPRLHSECRCWEADAAAGRGGRGARTPLSPLRGLGPAGPGRAVRESRAGRPQPRTASRPARVAQRGARGPPPRPRLPITPDVHARTRPTCTRAPDAAQRGRRQATDPDDPGACRDLRGGGRRRPAILHAGRPALERVGSSSDVRGHPF